jgi:hypothetical protein
MSTGQSFNRGCAVGAIAGFLFALFLLALFVAWLVTFGFRGGPAP